MSRFYYGMRLRGFSPGAQPRDGLIECLDDSKKAWSMVRPNGRPYHDVLVYNRPLSKKELEDYELDYIQEVGE